MALTTQQIALLDQLLEAGFASRTIKILGGKAEVTLNSLTAGDQLMVESYMKNMDGSPAFVVHTYSIKLVSQVLKQYHNIGKDPVSFKTSDDAEAFLKTRPTTTVDAIIEAHGKFENELKQLSRAEDLELNFTETPSPAPEPS
jgi:hypothetical protein